MKYLIIESEGFLGKALTTFDNRINIYQENSGFSASSRNKGMGLSTGRYLALLDGDDFLRR